ncbi:hypothetical protein EJH27_02065 [Salmonella enterica subsp. enterica serovar Virchow]|nr:hypothetical protein [Salmonella enterica subsp. enterica serovar Virchow]
MIKECVKWLTTHRVTIVTLVSLYPWLVLFILLLMVKGGPSGTLLGAGLYLVFVHACLSVINLVISIIYLIIIRPPNRSCFVYFLAMNNISLPWLFLLGAS